MSSTAITPDPRESAILAEVNALQRQQPQPPPAEKPKAAEETPEKPLSREQAILSEVSTLAPASREGAILNEVGQIAARREQPVISGTSFLSKALDVLNTPQQFVFGIVTKEREEGLLEAGVRGTKENARFADVLERELNRDPNAWGTAILGFTGDVLFDPLLFLPVGKIAKLGVKGLTELGKVGLTTAEHVAPQLSARLFESAVKPIAHAFSKTALRSAAEKDLIGLIDIELTKAQAKAQRILVEESAQRQIATDLAKTLGVPEDQILREVARRVEVKTGAQVAFPFATIKESERIVTDPQLTLFDFAKRTELAQEFNHIAEASKSASDDLLAGLPAQLPAAEMREVALQATSLKQRLENGLLREQSFGLKSERLEDATVDYLTHLTTPAAKKLLVKLPQFGNLGREFSPRHAFQLARQLDESHPAIKAVIDAGGSADIATLNLLWREGKLFPQLGKQASDLFITDPYVAAAVRRIRGEKAIADAQILTHAAMHPNLALPKHAAPAHFRPLNLPSDARFDRLRSLLNKFRFDPDVAAHLEQSIQTSLLPEGLDTFLKLFDTAQNIWKGITLHIFPAFHIRNAAGNVWNNLLAGLNNPKWYAEALKVQAGTVDAIQVAGKSVPLAQFRTMLEDFGITGQALFAQAETMRNVAPGALGKRVFATAEDIPVLGKAVTFGLKTGSQIEANARIAHFLWQLDKGASPVQAALSVKKYLFDYAQGLTKFEQSVMRRIMPFYSWTRFNIPLQASALVENPRPYIRLAEIVNTVRTKGIAGGKDFEEHAAAYRGDDGRYLAEFIKENAGIPFRIGPNGEPEFFLLSGWIPAADLEVFGSKGGMLERLKDLLSPFIKTPIEQIANKDLFLNRPLEEYAGQTQRFVGMEMRKRAVQLLRNVRILSEADRVLKLWQRDDLDPEMQSRLSTITRTIFGLKGYAARPEYEARRLKYEQYERRRQLKRAIRGNLPRAAELLGEEQEQ